MDSLRYSSLAANFFSLDDQVLPYHQASPAQQRSATRCARTDLGPAFPHLTLLDWVQVFARVQPDLYVMNDGSIVTYPSLPVLVRYLNQVYPAPPPAAPAYDTRTLYLAEKLQHSGRLVQELLHQLPAEFDLDPVLAELATPDAQALQVCQSLEWLPPLAELPATP